MGRTKRADIFQPSHSIRINIHRGYIIYIPILTDELANKYEHYIRMYETNPISEDTMSAGEELNWWIGRRTTKVMAGADREHKHDPAYRKRAWSKIKRLEQQLKEQNTTNVTANQMALLQINNTKSRTGNLNEMNKKAMPLVTSSWTITSVTNSPQGYEDWQGSRQRWRPHWTHTKTNFGPTNK